MTKIQGGYRPQDNLTNAGKGRPKGAVNKTTRTAKEAIAFAAEGLGGGERLAAWAKEAPENERTFWGTIYPKLLPLQVDADINASLSGKIDLITRRIIDPANG